MKAFTLSFFLPIFFLIAGSSNTFAQTKTVCDPDGMPYGWVLTDWQYILNACGGRGSWEPRYTFTKIDKMRVGSRVSACTISDLPAGWVLDYKQPCGGCCGGGNPNMQSSAIKYRYIIKKIK